MAVERIDYQAGSVVGKGALVWNERVSGKRMLDDFIQDAFNGRL